MALNKVRSYRYKGFSYVMGSSKAVIYFDLYGVFDGKQVVDMTFPVGDHDIEHLRNVVEGIIDVLAGAYNESAADLLRGSEPEDLGVV